MLFLADFFFLYFQPLCPEPVWRRNLHRSNINFRAATWWLFMTGWTWLMVAAAKELVQSIRLSTSLIIMLGCRIFRANSCTLLMCASKYLYELCCSKIGGVVKVPCAHDSSGSFVLCFNNFLKIFCLFRQIPLCLFNQKGKHI